MYSLFQSPSLPTDKLELQAHLSGYRVDVHVQLKKSRRVASSTVHQLDAVQDTSNRNPIFLSFSLAAENKHRGMSQLQWGGWKRDQGEHRVPTVVLPLFPRSCVTQHQRDPGEPSATEPGVARQCSAPDSQAEQVNHRVCTPVPSVGGGGVRWGW